LTLGEVVLHHLHNAGRQRSSRSVIQESVFADLATLHKSLVEFK
jgi:hypothetical protein